MAPTDPPQKQIRNQFFAFSLMLAFLMGIGFGYYLGTMNTPIEVTEVVEGLPEAPKIDLTFKRYKRVWMKDELPLDHVEFEYQGTRLYQYHSTGKIGYILRYKIKSKDAAHPLADHGKINRDENGKIIYPYTPNELCLKIENSHPSYRFTKAEGLWTEHWKPDGTVQCVSAVDGDSLTCSTWGDKNKGFISIEVHPSEGFYSTGEPKDFPPLHVIEVDFYFHPVDED